MNAASMKRTKFAQGLYAGKTQRQAARAAGYKGTQKTLDETASSLTHHPEVKAEMARLMAEHEARAVLARDEALKILTERARFDARDLFSLDENGAVKIDLAKAYKAGKFSNLVQCRIDVTGAVTVKWADPTAAISDLSKLLGWNSPEKKELSGKVEVAGAPIPAEKLRELLEEELKELADEKGPHERT